MWELHSYLQVKGKFLFLAGILSSRCGPSFWILSPVIEETIHRFQDLSHLQTGKSLLSLIYMCCNVFRTPAQSSLASFPNLHLPLLQKPATVFFFLSYVSYASGNDVLRGTISHHISFQKAMLLPFPTSYVTPYQNISLILLTMFW